jgi:predicted negative regulator of RcsB-dependent stress response
MKFLLVIGVIVILGALMVGFRMYRDRNATSMEETMRQFQRGLEALDPSNDPLARSDSRLPSRRNANDATGTDTKRQQNPASGRDNGTAQER